MDILQYSRRESDELVYLSTGGTPPIGRMYSTNTGLLQYDTITRQNYRHCVYSPKKKGIACKENKLLKPSLPLRLSVLLLLPFACVSLHYFFKYNRSHCTFIVHCHPTQAAKRSRLTAHGLPPTSHTLRLTSPISQLTSLTQAIPHTIPSE